MILLFARLVHLGEGLKYPAFLNPTTSNAFLFWIIVFLRLTVGDRHGIHSLSRHLP